MQIERSLIKGDPMAPNMLDHISEKVWFPEGERPEGNGWHMVGANSTQVLWGRIANRFQIAHQAEPADRIGWRQAALDIADDIDGAGE